MRKLGLAIVLVLLVGALFIPVEVRPINQHEGAVAFTQPTVKSVFPAGEDTECRLAGGCLLFGSDSWDIYSGQLKKVDINFSAVPEKYVAPEPVMKPLWQSLFFPTGSVTLQPISGSGDTLSPSPGTGTGGSTCTVTDKGNQALTYKTYATMVVTTPNGSQINWKSDVKTWTATFKVTSYGIGCTTGGPSTVTRGGWNTYITLGKVEVDYEPGTLYFTDGFGNYGVELKIWRVDEGASSDTQLASLAWTISVLAGDLA